MYVLYIGNYIGNRNHSSWSLRPRLLMTELEIAFEARLVPVDDGGSWRKFRRFPPTGQVPCLHDGGRVVWASPGTDLNRLAEVWREGLARFGGP